MSEMDEIKNAAQAIETLRKALAETQVHQPLVRRIVRLVEGRGQTAWGELYLRQAAEDLERYYFDVKPYADRLVELVQENQDKMGDPPAGMYALEVLVIYLEREWQGEDQEE